MPAQRQGGGSNLGGSRGGSTPGMRRPVTPKRTTAVKARAKKIATSPAAKDLKKVAKSPVTKVVVGAGAVKASKNIGKKPAVTVKPKKKSTGPALKDARFIMIRDSQKKRRDAGIKKTIKNLKNKKNLGKDII